MKRLLLLLFVILFITSCRKETSRRSENFESHIHLALKDTLLPNDYVQLDFSRMVQSKVDSIKMNVLRIPFKGKTFENFVLVEVSDEGAIKRGNIIQLTGKVADHKKGKLSMKSWNGTVQMSSLDRRTNMTSPIVNGSITALHRQDNLKTSLVAPSNVMPEVVITYTVSPDKGELSWSSWISIQSFFLDYGGPIWNNYYVPMDGGGSSSSGGGSSSGSGSPQLEPPVLIDIESQDEAAGLDLQKFINCFTAIPDDGAKCSIEILADIPVDTDPNKVYNFDSRSPGHTFINIRKNNGLVGVSQNIGFYPSSGFKSILTNAPIEGKFVDNGNHEYNCGFKMEITPAQLSSVLVKMQQLKSSKYDIDNFNCTDWALDVFNKVRVTPLQIPLYNLPYSPTLGTRTPNGLYNKLREMKNAGHTEAANITIDIVKGFAGNSTGPCY